MDGFEAGELFVDGEGREFVFGDWADLYLGIILVSFLLSVQLRMQTRYKLLFLRLLTSQRLEQRVVLYFVNGKDEVHR